MSALPDFFGGGIFGFAGWSSGAAVVAGATVMSGIEGEGARDMMRAGVYELWGSWRSSIEKKGEIVGSPMRKVHCLLLSATVSSVCRCLGAAHLSAPAY